MLVHVVAGLAAVALVAVPARADDQPSILFTAVHLLDGETERSGVDVRVEGDTVTEVGEGLEPREGERVVAGEGLTLLPGLVNARVHMRNLPLSWIEDIERTGVGVVAAEVGGEFPHSRLDALRHGVTTVIDAGSPTDDIVDLRDETAEGDELGPRMVVSGRMIVAAQADTSDDGRSGIRGLSEEAVRPVTGPADAGEAVREAVAAGVDFVSVGCEGAPGTVLDAATLAAVIDEAHASGLRVRVAGACETAAGEPAPRPDGFDGQTWLSTWAGRPDAGPAGSLTPALASRPPGPVGSRQWRRVCDQIAAARETGWAVLAGSGFPADDSEGPGDGLLRELSLLAACGLSHLDALAAATSAPARAFGLDGVVGCVRPGCQADLVLVRGDPLFDFGTLDRAEMVMLAGKTIVEEGVPVESLEEGSGRRRALVLPYAIYQDTYDLAGGADLVLLDPLGTGALFNLVVFASIRGYWATALEIISPDVFDSTRVEFAGMADNLPFTFFGIGNDTQYEDGTLVEPVRLLAALGIDRRLGGNLRAGLQYRFGSMRIEDQPLAEIPGSDGMVAVRGEYLSALTAYFEHDDRDTRSPIGGPRSGGRRLLSLVFGTPGIGNATTCALVRLELRQFVRLWWGTVLAMRFEGSMAVGEVPFAIMPSIGGDTGRGFYRGRFIDDVSLLLQVEYRFPIWWYFEGTVFYDTGRVFDLDRAPDSVGLHHSGGLGVRFNYNDSLVLRIDVGFSEEVIGNPIFQVAYPF